jgi:hypothetical protein
MDEGDARAHAGSLTVPATLAAAVQALWLGLTVHTG